MAGEQYVSNSYVRLDRRWATGLNDTQELKTILKYKLFRFLDDEN